MIGLYVFLGYCLLCYILNYFVIRVHILNPKYVFMDADWFALLIFMLSPITLPVCTGPDYIKWWPTASIDQFAKWFFRIKPCVSTALSAKDPVSSPSTAPSTPTS